MGECELLRQCAKADKDYNLEDARENARREAAQREILLTQDDQRAQKILEEDARVADYESKETQALSRTQRDGRNHTGSNAAPDYSPNGFKCDHPGCRAPTFPAQYLLKWASLQRDGLTASSRASADCVQVLTKGFIFRTDRITVPLQPAIEAKKAMALKGRTK